ncbi:hypothetical protein E6C27_scaffold274G005160 [Cucumis melo var. makuwa]|uniref:DUF4216 domain-containing protein n=1 Tax=Cucumis melo var. makuwa TaxID=1194695 RepID=A0A5A7UX48_CUCMM|nr:hypothetical protein E6C27_scaffold274G005160 [Cucumis melo var. makuwa]
MFQMHDVAELLTWHMNHKNCDGKMRHPVDSVSWDSIDAKWPDFSNNPRNLRFGLATDGFNPFSNLSSGYSCWPVMLVTYNLPPWLCMSKENIMLTLLIPSPKQSGNDFDIFLQPLIDDLKLLWDGVEVYDVVNKSNFNLRAMLIWTINDFLAYGNLARRFLPPSHPYRRKKSWFDGKVEDRQVPRITNENAIDTQLKDFQNFMEKVDKKKRKRQKELKRMWKKRSIFFDLPYWKELVLRHNLDDMHVEKNVCESIIGTLLDINGKSKDEYNARKDLQDMNIRQDLHPVERESRGYFPPSFFDILTHLVIHLGREVRLCGPVQFRWMYPFKRYMKTLKGFVRNQSCPEGCIAERFLPKNASSFIRIVFKISLDVGNTKDSDISKWLANGPHKTAMSFSDYYVYRLPMFKCDWAKIHNGVKVNDGFTLVNLHQNQSQFSSEPYILASQAKQVFYARENDNSPWYIVLKAPPRGFHELDKYDENVNTSFVGDGSSLALDDIDDEFECATIHGTIVKASYYDNLRLTVIL